MKRYQYIRRSLAFYKWPNLWVALGVVLATAILTGSLIVGDSVRYSLTRLVDDRLGKAQFAMKTGDRFFRTSLADSIAQSLDTQSAPFLQVNGVAIANGGERRLNHIQILGVDARFGKMGTTSIFDSLEADSIIINEPLASHLNLSVGDVALFRFEKINAMPGDAPLTGSQDQTLARRFRIQAIAGNQDFGRFDLANNQVTPYTAFMSLPSLEAELALGNKANGMLVSSIEQTKLKETLDQFWIPEDAGLYWQSVRNGTQLELRSDRIFMEPFLQDAISHLSMPGQPVFTYFVNRIESDHRLTPYSFVSAPGKMLVQSLKDDEILINQWLANDLGVGIDDTLKLIYFVIGNSGDLKEAFATFLVKRIVPLSGPFADRDLVPNFPGLADEVHCRDWKTGIPIDFNLIRDKDEDYWTRYGGTPKAFITMAAAQKLWQNRFGSATAIRFQTIDQNLLDSQLNQHLSPEQFGFVFRDVRTEGLSAGSQSVDFGQLFLGLSFFVIAAGLMLTGLLFVFHVESREEEVGLLLALGFTRKQVKQIILYEGASLALVGTLMGGVLGTVVNQITLYALKTVWSGIVGATLLRMHIQPVMVLIGMASSFLLSLGVMAIVIRKQMHTPITRLQRGRVEMLSAIPKISMIIGSVSLLTIPVMLWLSKGKDVHASMGLFFGTGTLLMIVGLSLINILIYFYPRFFQKKKLSFVQLSLMGQSRRRLRSLTLAGLLACGLFLVFTVGANRKSAVVNAEQRESGTGGFGLIAESTVPVLKDLNLLTTRNQLGITKDKNVQFVPFRVKPGDDASCLNLNRIAKPQLLGVDPKQLDERQAFTFAQVLPEVDAEHPWMALNQNNSDIIPAIADLTVIIWGLGKEVGDTLTYIDEAGKPFQILLVGGLANSIFQGNLILSEKRLLEKYPSISGTRFFLVDAAIDSLEQISSQLSNVFQDYGMDVQKTSDRLAAFNRVENTYLSIFLILGGFGLILGSIGIGIVVLRNMHERQGELALMRAIGYTRDQLQIIIFQEHFVLFGLGLVIGLISALIGTIPSINTPGTNIPYVTIGILILLVLINGIGWTVFAVKWAMRRGLVEGLREE